MSDARSTLAAWQPDQSGNPIFEKKEPGGARSFISIYCGVAIDKNMSKCGGVRSRASDCGYAAKKSHLNIII
jgi:hypothetical protein